MEILDINDLKIEKLLNRSQLAMPEQAETVRNIIADIRARGDEALFEYTQRFDKTALDASSVKVSEYEMEQAYKNTDTELIRVMKESASNIRDYYMSRKQAENWACGIFPYSLWAFMFQEGRRLIRPRCL